MTKYFEEQELEQAKKQKKKSFIIYLIFLGIYLVFSAVMFVMYFNLPYKSRDIAKLKLLHYFITGVFTIFSFIYLGIKHKRVRRYYKLCNNLATGLRETSVGSFFEYDNSLQDKDGVDMKSLVFIEWNKYKNDYFERKVLVLYDKPFPEIQEKANVKYITQGNVLCEYEIID